MLAYQEVSEADEKAAEKAARRASTKKGGKHGKKKRHTKRGGKHHKNGEEGETVSPFAEGEGDGGYNKPRKRKTKNIDETKDNAEAFQTLL